MPVFEVATATVMLIWSLGGDLEQIARLRKQSYCCPLNVNVTHCLGNLFGAF